MLEPRDVLAERIAQWQGEYRMYDFADRLIKDLDSAGWDIFPKVTDEEHFCPTCEGRGLVLSDGGES